MNKSQRNEIRNLTISAMLIALGVVLPNWTGMQLNSMLLPMHFPVLLAGLVLGPKYGLIVGVSTPLLRSVTHGMPPMLPIAVAMAFELGTYGFVGGLIYSRMKQNIIALYVSLISAMLIGRIVFGIVMYILTVGFGLGSGFYSLYLWSTGVFVLSWPGIIAQLVIIPIIVIALEKSGVLRNR